MRQEEEGGGFIAWVGARCQTMHEIIDQATLWHLVLICIHSGVKVNDPPRLGQRIDPSKLVNGATARLSPNLANVYFSLSAGRG